jgi:hypothetical protein
MTTLNDQHRTVDLGEAKHLRVARSAAIRRASAKVRRAQAAWEAAVDARDRLMIEHHGDRRDGGLSYEDLADATGTNDEERISKGRVIQIVQGRSEYSLRQKRPADATPA